MIGKRGRGFYCTRQERAAIGARAAAGLSVSRLVLDLVRDDIDERPVPSLTAEETAELLDSFRVLAAFLRGLPEPAKDAGAPQTTGSGAGGPENGAIADREEGAGDSGSLPEERVRLSISATDEEWAMVHERASQRGLSRSRYLVGLVLPDATIAGRHGSVLPALNGVEQREVLEGVRRISALLSETGDSGAALTGMRERLAALPDAGGAGLAGEGLADDGRKRKPRSRPTARGGGRAETGDIASVSWPPPVAVESLGREKTDEDGVDVESEPSDQGVLL